MGKLHRLLAVVSLAPALALTLPGCSLLYSASTYTCPTGQTIWSCIVKGTPCHMAYVNPTGFCASDDAGAIAAANSDAIFQLKLMDQTIVGTTCTNTGVNTYQSFNGPMPKPQGPAPSCDPTATDDACLACAKAPCCADYQACFQDTNCTCLVGCEAQGRTPASCAVDCGPYDDVSTSSTACIVSSCAAVCPTAGPMAPGMCPTSTGTGAGGSPSCTPGAAGSGEACFSNGDCMSCECSNDYCN